jgi:hypothetical protein
MLRELLNASRSFSLLDVLTSAGFSTGSAARRIAGAANVVAAAVETMFLTNLRRDGDSGLAAIVSSPIRGDCDLAAILLLPSGCVKS